MKRRCAIGLLLLIGGCAAAQAPTVSTTGPHETSVPLPSGTGQPTYAIGPGDQLQVNIYGQPDLSKEYAVTPEGNLSLPLIGQVNAGGRSVVQLEQELRTRFAEYLVNPQVTVAVQQVRQRFTVLGEVQKPGSYRLEKRTTVLEAVSIAGGLTPKAAPNRTKVIRSTGAQETTLVVPIGDIMRGGDQAADVPLKPNDKIVVPESFF